MTIAAFVPNVFDRSRFGDDVVFVSTPAEAVGCEPDVLLVDIDRCPDVSGFRIDGAQVIGFGSHVDTDAQAEATAAGYHEVLARSVFFRRLPTLLASEADAANTPHRHEQHTDTSPSETTAATVNPVEKT